MNYLALLVNRASMTGMLVIDDASRFPRCGVWRRGDWARRELDADRSSAFELGDQTKQIATQPAAVAAREPGCARSIERLGDGIRGRNHL